MVNQVNDPTLPAAIQDLLKHLARRNLLRGFRLGLPTGQAVAEALGITPLTNAQLTQGVDPAITAALQQGNFLDRTPLWFYVLREAERNAQGNTLGEVGSQIVAETMSSDTSGTTPRHTSTRAAGHPALSPASRRFPNPVNRRPPHGRPPLTTPAQIRGELRSARPYRIDLR